MFSFNFKISANHPCLPGHFPKNPIIPGAVIIDRVLQGLYKNNPKIKVTTISFVKFIQPIEPDVNVIVNIKEKHFNLLQFECLIDNTIATTGQLGF